MRRPERGAGEFSLARRFVRTTRTPAGSHLASLCSICATARRTKAATAPGGGHRSGLVNDADMGCDDSPPLGEADPGLHLPSDLARRAVSPEQRGGDGAVAAVGHDPGLLEPPREAGGGAAGGG